MQNLKNIRTKIHQEMQKNADEEKKRIKKSLVLLPMKRVNNENQHTNYTKAGRL